MSLGILRGTCTPCTPLRMDQHSIRRDPTVYTDHAETPLSAGLMVPVPVARCTLAEGHKVRYRPLFLVERNSTPYH